MKSESNLRKVSDTPLGTKFRYPNWRETGRDTRWVLLQIYEYGLCAKWEGIDGWTYGQSVCSITEGPNAMDFVVEICEDQS